MPSSHGVRKKSAYSNRVVSWKAYKWQTRRKAEKIEDMKVRHDRLNSQPFSLNPPKEEDYYPWVQYSRERFREECGYKPVKVTGRWDQKNQILITRPRDAQNGYEIVTPFITHKNRFNEECKIYVDRGWVQDHLVESIQTEDTIGEVTIQGILGSDEGKTKNSIPNDPKSGKFFFIDLNEFCDLQNTENSEARIGMMREMQVDDKSKIHNTLIKRPNKEFMMDFTITPERHQAYAYFWLFCAIMSPLLLGYVLLLSLG